MVLPAPSTLYTCQIRPILELGYSVIPLCNTDKNPAIKTWKDYQDRLPSAQEWATWLKKFEITAYGIICGNVSGIVVLDWDQAASAEIFKREFAHLTATYTVQSGNRHMPHYYFAVDFPVPTQALHGGDLKGEGGYVVGVGSVINGKEWTVINDSPPYKLNEAEYQAILARFPRATAPAPRPTTLAQTFNSGDFDGIRYFQAHIDPLGGRNNALFQTACVLRDKGYTQSEAENLLTTIYVQTPAPSDHPPESVTSRERAARCSIASAYRQSPRPNAEPRPVAYVETNAEGELVSRLPNALREYLLTFDEGASVLRVWESLLLAGFAPGREFTRREAYAQLAEGVGRPALDAALHFSLDGEPLFLIKNRFCPTNVVRIKGVNQPPLSEEVFLSALAGKGGAGENQNRPAGAPRHVYVMPAIREICQRLRLNPRQGDPLRAQDLQTRGTYRGAMHREFIKRRTGKADNQKWQADRLGVKERTIRRYNQAQNIQSTPRTIVQIVLAHNLDLVPVEGHGQYLEDKDGNRYPPLRASAQKFLLKGGGHTFLKFHTYTTSLYSVGDEVPDWEALGIPTEIYPSLPARKPQSKPELPPRVFKDNALPAAPTIPPTKQTVSPPSAPPMPPPTPARHSASRAKSPRPAVAYQPQMSDPRDPKFFKPLPDAEQERVAQCLYNEVPHLSLCNARRLTYDFGAKPVARCWQWLKNCPFYAEIHHPAGYLIDKIKGQALKTRTTVNPQEFHGQAYAYRDWHPDKPKVTCQCQYCAKTVTTETPFAFCSPDCEQRSSYAQLVFALEFGDWNCVEVLAPAGGWRLGVEQMVEFEGFPHLRVRVKLDLNGQFEQEVIVLPDVEPSIPPRPKMPAPPPKPRQYGPDICPATGVSVIMVYHSEVSRISPDASRQWFWRYRVEVLGSRDWYYLLIPKGEDICAPTHFLVERH